MENVLDAGLEELLAEDTEVDRVKRHVDRLRREIQQLLETGDN
jgi:hypothetical protein